MLVAGLVVINGAVRSDAVLPGQPGVIAFASDRAGDFDIHTVDPSSGTVAVLFDTPEDERYPAWSPDGSKVAFIREKTTSPCSPSAACEELWVRTIATGAETRLVTGVVNGFLYTPSWSPDGTTIAYVARDSVNPRDVFLVPSSGGTPVQVTAGSASELSPDWSPDGTKLAVSISGVLYTVPANATNGSPAPSAITLSGTVPSSAREPSWAPDGRITFFGGTSSFDYSALYVTSANGSGTQVLWDSGTASLANPSWASDGGKIAVSLIAASGEKSDLRVYDPCTGQATALATSTADDLDPAWRPSLPAPSTMPPACASPSSSITSPPPTTTSPPPTTSPPTTTTSSPPTSSSSAPPPSPSSSSTTTTTTSPPPTSPTSTTSSPPPTPPPGTTVAVSDTGFDPIPVRIRRGGTVVWENSGPSAHEVVDETGLELFSLPMPAPGFGSHAFIAAGRYRYVCATHPTLSGSVSVPITSARIKGSPVKIDVTWASEAAPDGFAYDVQVRRPDGRWRLWKDDVSRASAVYLADAGDGTYRFRARFVRTSDAAQARWSIADAIRVGS